MFYSPLKTKPFTVWYWAAYTFWDRNIINIAVIFSIKVSHLGLIFFKFDDVYASVL